MTIADVMALFLSVALPWLAGTLLVRSLTPRIAEQALAVSIGYGYFVGLFALTLAMRALDLVGLRWTVYGVAAPIAAIALIAGWIAWRQGDFDLDRRAGSAWRAMPPVARSLAMLLLLLTASWVVTLGLYALSSPLVPLDTWSQWASKSRVWYEYRRLVPFVEPSQWLGAADVMQFTDVHARYPATVPLLQVWVALCLGRWDESLVNLPWPLALASFGIAFFAQLRRARLGVLEALFASYLVVSLPFLTIYVALAGLADPFVAIAYGLAAAAMWHWTLERQRHDAMLAIAMAIFCAALKREGSLWALTLVPGAILAYDRRLGAGVLVAGAAAIVGYLLLGPAELVVSDYVVLTRLQNVAPVIYEHLFVMDNWHVLWYAVVLVLVLHHRSIVAPPLAPLSVAVACGGALVFMVFFFTSAAVGVKEESLTNRLPLEGVPGLVFYVAVLLQLRYAGACTRTATGSARKA